MSDTLLNGMLIAIAENGMTRVGMIGSSNACLKAQPSSTLDVGQECLLLTISCSMDFVSLVSIPLRRSSHSVASVCRSRNGLCRICGQSRFIGVLKAFLVGIVFSSSSLMISGKCSKCSPPTQPLPLSFYSMRVHDTARRLASIVGNHSTMPASIQRNTNYCLTNSASILWHMLSKTLLLAGEQSGLLNLADNHDRIWPRSRGIPDLRLASFINILISIWRLEQRQHEEQHDLGEFFNRAIAVTCETAYLRVYPIAK